MAVDRIVASDARFDRDAYLFVRDALEYTTKQQKKRPGSASAAIKSSAAISPNAELNVAGRRRVEQGDLEARHHVSAQQLLEGIRQYAILQYGPMVPTVFEHWRVRSCEDIGVIVFNLIDAAEFGKSEQDSIEDFRRGYDFHEVFVQPFRPAAGKAQTAAPTRVRSAPDRS